MKSLNQLSASLAGLVRLIEQRATGGACSKFYNSKWQARFRLGAVSMAAFVLAACGQGDPEDVASNEVSGVEPSLSESSVQAATEISESSKTSAVTSSDRLFGRRVFSLEEALNTEVMGLKLDMIPGEVVSTLAGRGFEPVLTEKQKKQDLTALVGDLQFHCRENNSQRCVPAAMQQTGVSWTRASSDDQTNIEFVYPLFYLDTNRQPKLFSVLYKHSYGVSNTPPDVISAMIERFGEPTVDQSSVSPEGIQTGRLSYYIQAPIPRGLIPANVDTREEDEDMDRQHPVRVTRFSCLNDKIANVSASLTQACEQALNGDSDAYWMYEALASDRKINSGSNNRFLFIENYNTSLSIQLVGEMLPVAIEMSRRETNLRNQLEARKAQLEQTYSAPSDL